jgi:eukaryotic-like serine/threonine-protein kinase
MPLGPGARLGPYEIVAAIGAGGMGEVYRATDTNLGRQVAIKILPDAFAQDPERVARFEREAKTLASLNHPHIAIIHGLEKSHGTYALVMELVEGEDLSKRIARGPIPIDEALPIAKQIAEALEAAHEQGVVHRDLKPANIKVRADGTVKVLDFGLAKLAESLSGARPDDLSMSPTITSPALVSGVGVLLGTAAYMSPEQARGKVVDKRTDIWAFGCVLFEMLTGGQAFAQGDTVSDAIAAILATAPNWSALPSRTPAAIRRLLRRCLQKDPRERLHDIGDARLELKESVGDPNESEATVREAKHFTLRNLAVIAIAAAIAAFSTWLVMRPSGTPASVRTSRFTITPPEDHGFLAFTFLPGTTAGLIYPVLAIAPDGRQVVYSANGRLYQRRLDNLVATPIRGTEENPYSPAFSPDGNWIAYLTENKLKKIAVTGGVAITLCDALGATDVSWPSDRIVFVHGPLAKAPGIYQVSESGGTPQRMVAASNAERFGSPQLLPDGRNILFTAGPNTSSFDEDAEIVVQSLRNGERRTLVRGGHDGRVLPSGHLLYVRNGTALAEPIDVRTFETSGGPTPVLENVSELQFGAAQVAVSATGAVVYVEAAPAPKRVLTWIDRSGGEQPISAPPGAYVYPVISPDGSQVALTSHDRNYSISIWNLARETLTRLTQDNEDARYSVWTPDGQRIIYSAGQSQGLGARRRLMWRSADGTGAAEALTELANQYPHAASPDGHSVVFRRGDPVETDLMLLPLTGDRKPSPLVQKPLAQMNADISPDGRWIAYQSNEAAPGGTAAPADDSRYEIYVQPFPDVASGRWLVSTHGGTRPRWSRNGRELYYLTADRRHIAMVAVDPGKTFSFQRAVDVIDAERFGALATAEQGRMYDVSPDGRRFLILKPVTNIPRPELVLIENWFTELEQRVPVK